MTIVEIGKAHAKAADAAQSEVDLRLDKNSGMDGMTTRPEPPEPASTAEEGVRKDLIAIRGTKEGLGVDAVRRHGSDLQSLRVVTNEMLRGNLAPGQRPEASVLAVRCAVHYLIPAPWTVMLRHTLLKGGGSGVRLRKTDSRWRAIGNRGSK